MADQGYVLWVTGLSGAGTSTVAGLVEAELRARGAPVESLDGDVVRTHLSKGLGFGRADRDTNVLRDGFVAGLLSRHGIGVRRALRRTPSCTCAPTRSPPRRRPRGCWSISTSAAGPPGGVSSGAHP